MEAFAPIHLTDAQLIATNVPENDHPAWASGTTYADGDRVIVVSTHSIYESVQSSNTGNDPATDDGTWWIKVSATNRWAAFDLLIAASTSNAGTITYEISPSTLVTDIAFFNIGAPTIQVRVEDPDGFEVYNQTKQTIDTSGIIDWVTFFTVDISEGAIDKTVFKGIPGFPTYRIFITVGDGAGTATIGEIAYGKMIKIGEALSGSTVGLTSFSTKERDTFGNWIITPRENSDSFRFNIASKNTDIPRIRRFLNSLENKAAVYSIGDGAEEFGGLAYGFFIDYEIPYVGDGKAIFTLEIQGLT